MKNVYFIIVFSLLFNGCVTKIKHEKNEIEVSQDNKCHIMPNVLLNGQIRYFHGMDLRLPACPILEKWQFDRYNDQANQEIFKALNLDPTSPEDNFLYVDIKFYASKLSDGTVVIRYVEEAKRTKNNIFD